MSAELIPPATDRERHALAIATQRGFKPMSLDARYRLFNEGRLVATAPESGHELLLLFTTAILAEAWAQLGRIERRHVDTPDWKREHSTAIDKIQAYEAKLRDEMQKAFAPAERVR